MLRMRKNLICGLDIGSYKICATCGMIDPSGKIDVLATQTVSTQGLKSGRIINSRKLSDCIRDAVRKLGKMCGMRIRRVYANVDSPDLKAKVYEKQMLFAEKTKVKRSHLDWLINSAIFSKDSLNRKVIHTGMRSFLLDRQSNYADPEGRLAQELELKVVTMSVLIPTIESFVKSVKAAGLILENMVPSACAQAQGFFKDFKPDTEKNNILVDVGSALTKVSLFRGSLVKDLVVFPLGAQSISENIAVKLKVSFDCAEQLKIKYGRTHCEDRFFSQKIIVRDKLVNRIIQPQHLYESIAVKVDYLLQEIKKSLIKLNYGGEALNGIIVTGGGSILEGFLERAEKILGQPVKMGFLSLVKDHRIQSQSAVYATSIGLIQFGFKNRVKLSRLLRAKFNPLAQAFSQARGLYREYF